MTQLKFYVVKIIFIFENKSTKKNIVRHIKTHGVVYISRKLFK